MSIDWITIINFIENDDIDIKLSDLNMRKCFAIFRNYFTAPVVNSAEWGSNICQNIAMRKSIPYKYKHINNRWWSCRSY